MARQLSSPAAVLIRARALTGFPELVARHRGDCAALLASAGIAPELLAQPEETLPLPRMVGLLNDAAKRLQVPDFGFQLGLQQDIGVLGAVSLIAQHAATLGEACLAISRHLPYHCPGIQVHVEPDAARAGYTQIRFVVQPGEELPMRQTIELCFGVALRYLTGATGDSGADWHIACRHSTPLSRSRYQKYFAGQLRFEQAHDALSLPSRWLQLPVAPDGASVQAAAERYVSNVIHRFPLDIAQQVEQVLARQLAAGSASLVQVARQLGLHERTLQRRLKEQGVYFEDIVDRLRCARAREYLSYPAIPLAQIAALLGYTEQSTFIRACRRWFGTTPQAYRTRGA